MANTYTQLYVQLVIVVKFRAALIKPDLETALYKYITGIVQANGHKMIIINGMPDHLHLLIGLNPAQSISVLMQKVKASSSKWMNEQGFLKARFEWQAGYGAFSYAQSELNNVIRYIENQKAHHSKKTFHHEYTGLLKQYDVDYQEEYLFKKV